MPRRIDRNDAPPAETQRTAAPAPANTRKIPEPPAGEEIDSGDVDEMIALGENESMEAVYLGHKEVNVTVRGKTQVSRIHKFKFDDGVARGIWGSYMLDGMLAKVNPGTYLWVAYLGKETQATGNEMHSWRVVKPKKPSANTSLPSTRGEVPF